MEKLFSDLPEALQNNYNLPLRCSFRPEASDPVLPNISSEKGEDADKILLKDSFEGLKENKTIAHIAVLITLIALLGLSMPLKSAIADGRGTSVIRILLMIVTGIIAITTFVISFIKARKNK